MRRLKPTEETPDIGQVNLFTDFLNENERHRVYGFEFEDATPIRVPLWSKFQAWWTWKLNNFPGDDGTKGNALLIAVMVTWTISFLVGLPYIAYLMYKTVGVIQ